MNVPTGGRKKKLNASIATTETTIATRQAPQCRGAQHDQQQRQRDRRRADRGQDAGVMASAAMAAMLPANHGRVTYRVAE